MLESPELETYIVRSGPMRRPVGYRNAAESGRFARVDGRWAAACGAAAVTIQTNVHAAANGSIRGRAGGIPPIWGPCVAPQDDTRVGWICHDRNAACGEMSEGA